MPPVYKDSTYEAASLWCEDTAVAYGENCKRNPSKSYDRYERYRQAKTLGESLQLGSKWQDLFFDFEHGMLKIVGPPFRDSPLDLTKVLPDDATDFEREMARSVNRAALTKRTEVLAERLGMDKRELGSETQDGETLEMHGQRMEAVASAKRILEAASREQRKVTNDEVLLVLSQWAFKNNDSRQNVLPEGQRFVKSDTFGLIPLRDGTVQVTRMTREYPEVCRLFCRWLQDHRPADLAEDHVFTSINVNSGYAAKLHRDAGNVGPSMIKAFGKFSGGLLRYWPDDNQHLPLVEVRKHPSMVLDLSQNLALFNGACAHEVEPFEGQRFTLVYFSVGKFARADPDSHQVCLDCGINMPTDESMERARRLLRQPRGYGAGALPAAASDARLVVGAWQLPDSGVGAVGAGDSLGFIRPSRLDAESAASPAAAEPVGEQAAAPSGDESPLPSAGDAERWVDALAAALLEPTPQEPAAADVAVVTTPEAIVHEAIIDVQDASQVSTPAKRPALDAAEASAAKRPRGSRALDSMAEKAERGTSTYCANTCQEVRRWTADTLLEYVPDGKRPGTASSERYEKYSKARTVAEALELGSRPRDLLNDYEKGLLKVIGGPVRDEPLDLHIVRDLSILTATDKVLARMRWV